MTRGVVWVGLVLVGWAILFRVLDVNFGNQLALLYARLRLLDANGPQAFIWIGIVGLFGLLAIRALPFKSQRAQESNSYGTDSSGPLAQWIRLLGDRERGPYFRWRVARRVSKLARELGAPPPQSDNLARFLAVGTDQRTIQTDPIPNIDPESLADYLESALDEKT